MSPPVLVLTAFFVLPMIIMAIYSFRLGTFAPERDSFTLEHYAEYFGNLSYHRLLLQSVVVAFITSLLSVLFAYPIAYFLVFRAGQAQLTLLTILLVPAWTSYLLRILAWKLILGSGGLLNSLLLSTGLIKEASPILLYSQTAVIVTLVYVWVPFVVLPIFSALQRIDRSLLEAASDLGCSQAEAFLRVTLPLSLPGVVAGFLFVFIPTLGEWVTPSLVGGVQGTLFGNIIQDQFVRALNWPLGSLMSLVMLVLMIIQLALFSRVIRLNDLAGV